MKGVEEKPMLDKNAPQIKYDVFVSFRGKDIRDGILSHLIEAFESKKIYAFVDDKLERGEEIWPSLVEAIEGSFISLIMISQNYASSRWCLEELVTILECKEKHGRIVIPVFYHVEPTHVQHQSFVELEKKHENKVQIWRAAALNKSAKLSGIVSSNFRNDAELLKEIVHHVLARFSKPLVSSKELIGIDEKIADVESLISEKPQDTCLIGIWGMGGIGKTTLAEEVFNKNRSEYEHCYFLANEREESNRHGITYLKETLFSKLLGYDVKIDTPNSLPEDIVRRIRRTKVLIVLDDVNDLDHVKRLLGTLDNFGSGSRIIVTTRDEQVLNANKAHVIYRLGEFSSDKALELFNLIAFNQNNRQREYDELSKELVHYAKGIPLVLKVLAQRLHGKNKVWESELDKLKKMPPPQVYDVMKLSYDDLDRQEQQIFLDLACFFLRLFRKVNVGNLKCLLKNCDDDNSVVVGLERLKDKALITFSENNFISMHDSLQEMGWEIVRRESSKDPGSCSRLWDPDDVCEALKDDKGAGGIRSIRIHDLRKIKEQKLNPHIFTKMIKLKFLEIYGSPDQHDILAKGIQFLATELKYLCWYCYGLKSLPQNFVTEELVILKLPFSRMEKLWDGVKNLVNLKELDLNNSEQLKELPDLSKATNLEVLVLSICSMLTKVHPSIFSLGKLDKLDLRKCKSLTILSSDFHLKSLSYLNLDDCKNLTKFSVISDNMKELRLERTKIKELPSSFGHQSKLKSLHLIESGIERLPSSFKNLTQVQHLDVTNCSELQTIAKLPPFRETLEVGGCKSLQSLPELPSFLEFLYVKCCYSLQTIPKLPSSLETLVAGFCKSLQSLPELPLSLKTLNVDSCESLQVLPELPLSLKTLEARFFESLQSLPKLPQYLKTLNVECCKSIKSLPELPPSLKTLEVQSCPLLQTLPKLPLSLETLNATKCRSLKTVLLDHSTAVEQLRENRTKVLFWDCSSLDEHCLMAIGLNAKSNVMKFANQHLPAPNHDHVRNFNDYEENYRSYQVVYVYPGSSVPKWLEYETANNYITIDLSSTPPSPMLGFVFSFILSKNIYINNPEFNITVSDGESEGKNGSVRIYLDYCEYSIFKSDHVCVMYDQRCSYFLNSKAKNEMRFKIVVTMKGKRDRESYTLPQKLLKGFGVSTIRSSTYTSFVQQMELGDSDVSVSLNKLN